MAEFTADWLSSQLGELQMVLSPYVGRPNLAMLEIGAFEGRSTLWFLEHVLNGPGSHLTTIDTWQGSEEHATMEMEGVYDRFRRNTRQYVSTGRLTVIMGPSQQFLAAGVVAKMHAGVGSLYDVIYVDGSHAAADVLSDAVLSWALLNPGGVIVFDDYLWRGVPEEQNQPQLAIDSFLACFRGQYDAIHRGYQVAVRKREC